MASMAFLTSRRVFRFSCLSLRAQRSNPVKAPVANHKRVCSNDKIAIRQRRTVLLATTTERPYDLTQDDCKVISQPFSPLILSLSKDARSGG